MRSIEREGEMSAEGLNGRGHEILTPEEAAAYLRVNPQTIYRLLRAGQCPGMKVGRQWRIRRQDLDNCFTTFAGEQARSTHDTAERSRPA